MNLIMLQSEPTGVIQDRLMDLLIVVALVVAFLVYGYRGRRGGGL
jgi:hypothetical protein